MAPTNTQQGTAPGASPAARLRAAPGAQIHPLSLPDAALITEAQVRLCVPFGRTRLHEMIVSGEFPAPQRKPGTRVRLWRVKQVRQWIDAHFPEAEVQS